MRMKEQMEVRVFEKRDDKSSLSRKQILSIILCDQFATMHRYLFTHE